MAHDRSREARPSKFCGVCGAALPTDARFCPSCGQPAAQPLQAPAPAATSAAASSRARSAAGVVFALFVVAGAGAFWLTSAQSAPKRAVPGTATPSATGAAAAAIAGKVPPGHPNIGLPQEVVVFLDELAAKAKTAPDDLEAWQNLARARYRAALLNTSRSHPTSEL